MSGLSRRRRKGGRDPVKKSNGPLIDPRDRKGGRRVGDGSSVTCRIPLSSSLTRTLVSVPVPLGGGHGGKKGSSSTCRPF